MNMPKSTNGRALRACFSVKYRDFFVLKTKKEHGFPFNRFHIGGGKNHALFIMFFFRFPTAQSGRCPLWSFRRILPEKGSGGGVKQENAVGVVLQDGCRAHGGYLSLYGIFDSLSF